MKQLKAVILGYGDRSTCYSQYALKNPEKIKIIAVIDVDEKKLQLAKKIFDINNDFLFNDLDSFLGKKIDCDVVINGTMDNLHYSTTIKLLKNKYNVLLEKPITPNAKELIELKDLANKNNCKVVVCHVLRYTAFYKTIKQIIDSGELGKITDLQLNEHVWPGHFVNSFVRGKWNSEKKCGSSLLLQKCCHDTDIMCWLNNDAKPVQVASFGGRALYTEKNAPKGATEFCFDCPHKEDCYYNAGNFTLKMDAMPIITWAELGKPHDQLTIEEKQEYLKRSNYGRCVYKTDMDIVDRQCVIVNFNNGSVGTLNVVGGATKSGRNIHLLCERGEILGNIEDNKIIKRKLLKDAVKNKYEKDEDFYEEQEIDLCVVDGGNSVSGHYGGDYNIMEDLVNYLSGQPITVSTTVIEDSVNSHLICYAAEKARKNSIVVDLTNEYGKED